MTVPADTLKIIDYLRGERSRRINPRESETARFAAREPRLEVLGGMRRDKERGTRSLLTIFIWHPVDTSIAESAGELGRRWITSHQSIDSADLAIAAISIVAGCDLLTCNVRIFNVRGSDWPY
jgi:predicted nucleic acid-binding protein